MLSHLCSRSIIYFIFLHDSLKNFTSCDTRCYTVQNPVLRFLVYINDFICRFLSNKDVFLYSKGRNSVFKRGVSQSSKGRGLKKFSRGLHPRTPIIPYPPTSRLLAPPLGMMGYNDVQHTLSLQQPLPQHKLYYNVALNQSRPSLLLLSPCNF